jgi:hypothetical protein
MRSKTLAHKRNVRSKRTKTARTLIERVRASVPGSLFKRTHVYIYIGPVGAYDQLCISFKGCDTIYIPLDIVRGEHGMDKVISLLCAIAP